MITDKLPRGWRPRRAAEAHLEQELVVSFGVLHCYSGTVDVVPEPRITQILMVSVPITRGHRTTGLGSSVCSDPLSNISSAMSVC